MSDDSKFVPSGVFIPRNKQPWATPDFNPYGTSNSSILREGDESGSKFKAFGTFVKKNVEDYLKKVETSQGMTDELLGGSGLSGVGGLAGTFIGKNATNFDEAMERMAYEMRERGASPEEIWNKTGTRRWASGARQEINDMNAGYSVKGFDDPLVEHYKKVGDKFEKIDYDTGKTLYAAGEGNKVVSSAMLNKLINHPELFKNYPQLKNTRVLIDPNYRAQHAAFDPDTNQIIISASDFANRDTNALLHEIQHKVQNIEGWQDGGSPDQFTLLDRILPKKADGKIKWWKPFEQYQRLPGEVEARITQDRQYFTDKMRRDIPPTSLDVPMKDMLIHKKKYGVKK